MGDASRIRFDHLFGSAFVRQLRQLGKANASEKCRHAQRPGVARSDDRRIRIGAALDQRAEDLLIQLRLIADEQEQSGKIQISEMLEAEAEGAADSALPGRMVYDRGREIDDGRLDPIVRFARDEADGIAPSFHRGPRGGMDECFPAELEKLFRLAQTTGAAGGEN